MNLNQLTQGLDKAFNKEGHRIVFWYDPEHAFESDLAGITLDNVNVVNMRDQSVFGMKLKLERKDAEGRYLLYFPSAEPEVAKDWLLDIKLYSRCFYADRVSLLFNDLGLANQAMREHLAAREAFFASKRRTGELKKYLQADAREEAIDLAMLAVVTRADQADLAHVLFALAGAMVELDEGLEVNPDLIDTIIKFGLMPALLTLLQKELGYQPTATELEGSEPLQLGRFFIQLLVTGFTEGLGELPDWARGQVLSRSTGVASARSFLSRWRDSSRYYRWFDEISHWVADALLIERKLEMFSLDELAEVETFKAVEIQLIKDLSQQVVAAHANELIRFKALIAKRQDKYWACRHHDDDTRRKFRLIYQALSAAVDLFALRQRFETGFHFASCQDFYQAYTDELYQFDMAYRHYVAASQQARVEVLKSMDAVVEQCYANWYLDHLAKAWGDKLAEEDRLQHWRLSGVTNQQDFYHHYIHPLVSGAKAKRVAVIISDAFRYEAAVELKSRINEKRYSEATLSSQLGVLPSYTTLGMASLLPHQELAFNTAGDDVLLDGVSTKSTAQRNKILAAVGGMAVTAEEVKGWNRDQGREALKGKSVVYIYHNMVDARGDSASTESETFDAVEDAINDLTELVRKITSNLNTSTVFVTADHGFIYQASKLECSDKTRLDEKPAGALKSKKRYVIGRALPDSNDVWRGEVKHTAGSTCDTQFWVPKGNNRFHFVGGARFVHGGVMPQEIAVPVLIAKGLRGEKAEKRTKRKAGVISAKSNLRMVNNIQAFDLMQTDAVSEQVLPVTVLVGLYDGEQLISSEERVTFDSTSEVIGERVKSVRLSLAGGSFDRKNDYFMVLRDADHNTEIERYKVVIDLAFTDDFF
ncbi:MAG: BREX-1 system phosphatase PglZ type A [Thiotrichaceae bacterium]|nr:BREX-1 system phosphatase PglZ type A [Thiotrichaceae bacterium]